MTLTEFLLARIDEDEARLDVPGWYCTESARGEGWGSRGDECPECGRYMFDGTESATEDAWEMHMADAHGRVLAECEAKRRIVDAYEDERQRMDIYNRDYPLGLLTTDGDLRARLSSNARWAGLDVAVRALVQPYADHPDYDEAWRP